MLTKECSRGKSDYHASYLRARIATLIDILRDLEENNDSPEYINFNLKVISKDLDKFRKECF